MFYYITNLQGDVVYVINSLQTIVAAYEYDPYGNVISSTGAMAQINPLRYRGYYYDTDTGLYYLQSRYFDPEMGRFINADVYVSTGQGLLGNNMFAYCGNSPVTRKDSTGDAYVFLDEFMTEVDPDGRYDEGGGGGGWGLGVNPSYYTAKATQAYDWNWQNSSYNQNSMPPQPTPQHTTGTSAPDKNINPGGSYVKIGDNGKIYSYTQFDSDGRQLMRIDFQGRSHRKILPHIHVYVYLERGGRKEYVYDLSWNRIG